MEGGTHANDLFHEQMIMTLRPQIEEEMLPVHVLFFLPGLRDIANDIMQADRRSHREAANLLIDSLLERRSPGWYTEFVDALKAAGFDKLAKRLNLQNVKNDEFFKDLISRCMPDLLHIQLMPVMMHLVQDKIISNVDMDEVMKLENEGHNKAVFELLFRLSIHRDDWIRPFVSALKKNNETAALKAIEPLLVTASSDESISRVLTNLEKANTEDIRSDPEKLKKLSEEVSLDAAAEGKESPVESGNDTVEEVLEFSESRQPSLEVNATNVNLLSTYKQDKDSSKGEKLVAKQVGVAKPMVAGGQQESSHVSDHYVSPSNSQRAPNETRAKEVSIEGASGGETPIKRLVGTASRQAVQETTPKSLSGGENWNIRRERTVVYSQDEGDLDLRPDPFSMRDRRTVNQDHASVSCSDNCQQSITNTATSVLSNDPSDDQGTLIPASDIGEIVQTAALNGAPYRFDIENSMSLEMTSNTAKLVTNEEFVFHERIGRLRYLTANVFRGEPLVHIREYTLQYGKEMPTKRGVAFTDKRWACFRDYLNEITRHVDLMKAEKVVDFSQHLGGKIYVTMKTGVKCIDLRRYFLPPKGTKVLPTRSGIALRLGEWNTLLQAIENLHRKIPDLNPRYPATPAPIT